MPAGSPLPQPSTLPEWATGGGALITTPGPGTIASGAVPNTDAIAQYENWKGKWTFKWLEWLKDFVHQALTWTGNHIFQGNVTVSGTATLAALSVTNLTASGDVAVGDDLDVTDHITLGGLLTANGQIQVNGSNADSLPDKRLHPGLICRGWIRLSFDGSNPPTKLAGRNIGGALSGGGGIFTVDCDANLGTSLSVQVTDWNATGGTYGNRVVVTDINVVSGKTRITCRTVNGASGATPPGGGTTGCYIEVKSAS